ncbi:MAG: hypothetical protein ACI4TX_02585 [Christensenellales bacterium]
MCKFISFVMPNAFSLNFSVHLSFCYKIKNYIITIYNIGSFVCKHQKVFASKTDDISNCVAKTEVLE